MIQLLAKRCRKAIAYFLFFLFYAESALAGVHRAAAVEEAPWYVQKNTTQTFPWLEAATGDNEPTAPSVDSMVVADRHAGNDNPYRFEIASAEDADDFGGGPTQPEMQAFQSVNSNNMVDLFTGDFSYNIPLMDVGGYPVNLSYRGGVTMEQDASWVGLGWNVNPGTVTRNMRGLPDDFNGANDSITKTTSIKDNVTTGVTIGGDIEIVGMPKGPDGKPTDTIDFGRLGLQAGIFHNNYRGWGLEGGINASISAGIGAKGGLTAGLGIQNNSQQGITISPSFSYGLNAKEAEAKGGTSGNFSISSSYNTRGGIRSLDLSAGPRKYYSDKKNLKGSIETSNSPSISFATLAYTPSISLPFTSTQFTFTAKLGFESAVVHPSVFVSGYGSSQRIESADQVLTLPAYGYINFQKGAKNPSALLDFNREKEIAYRENPPIPNIAIPSYSYDVFSVTGEGTGGMFRAYRGDIGFVYDHYIKSKDISDKFDLDLGVLPNLAHGGIDLNFNSAYTENGQWVSGNTLKDVVAFREADSTFEAVYFKNPGEKSINTKAFYDALGGDDVVTASLYQSGASSPYISATNYLRKYKNKQFTGTTLLTKSNTIKKERDKRSQVITYLTASEAILMGQHPNIENYAVNKWGLGTCGEDFPGNVTIDTFRVDSVVAIEKRVNEFRKPNHISEIDVLNADGRRYVYGIPVYNLRQEEVTFSVDHANGNTADGSVSYSSGSENSQSNDKGRDNYFMREHVPAYAHSYLLTSILSSDYADLTGNGITDDDLGDAVKFNYSKVAGVHNPFKWRTPGTDKNKASFNEGLKTDAMDDKGNYVYGEKELWYLNSIESRTMIATFKLEERKDLLPVDENGNKDTTQNNLNGAKRLREINLYTKADFLVKGTNAKPIKTVHFEYTYQLCKKVNSETGSSYSYRDSGKLMLTKVWFSYNGNSKKRQQNQYSFFYNSINPDYTNKAYDRWGNYKNQADNPGGLTNADYPFVTEDSATAASYAAAWTLDSIILPSAGRIKVNYESDDYAYVQNKRAMQMCKIYKLANSPTGGGTTTLYTPGGDDHLYVFIKSATTLGSKKDVYYKYLEGLQQLYFKLYVKMPPDQSHNVGYEFVPCYAELDTTVNGGYDMVDGTTFWVKIKGISLAGDADGSYSPLAKAAIQYLRLNLPALAYPGSEVGDNLGLKELVSMIAALSNNTKELFTSFDRIARKEGLVSAVDTASSFIRLNEPDYKKYGGGLRVKSIKIYDNWQPMSTQKQSVYGQEYTYTTTKEINGVQTIISSGVTSYEPMMGGEENPFHIPLRYVEKVAPLAPVNLGYVEEPLGEGFFPSAGVGYSKVRVRSINTANRKSANGYEESRFYTAYDFPTLVDNTMIDPDTKKRYKPALLNFLRFDAKHYMTLSQGFKIELNDMHGRIRYQATYAETNPKDPITYAQYYYKVDNQDAEFKHLSNTVMAMDEKGVVDTTAVIGKDVELMTDMRQQLSVSSGNNIGLNMEGFWLGIIPILIPSKIPFPVHEENLFRSVAMTKIIQRYGIIDSVVQVDKGSMVSTRNLLFDSETGDVLLSRTNNEFNDPLYNFSYPAHWVYSGMGQAYKNIQALFSDITINSGVPQGYSKYPAFKSYFESGDEILAIGRLKTGESPSLNCDGIESSCPVNVYSDNYDTVKIWAVDARKMDPAGQQSIVFIDAEGKAYSATDVSMKIYRSGKRNISTTPVGTITSLINPLQVKSGKLQLVLDSTSKVIASSAGVLTDFWRVASSKKSYNIDNSCSCGPLRVLFDYLIDSGRLFIQQIDHVSVGTLINQAASAGYAININDCPILTTNENQLFYALTSATSGTLYKAKLGNAEITIKSSNASLTIQFDELQSKDCTGDGKVYYRDMSKVLVKYKLVREGGVPIQYTYNGCPSQFGIWLNRSDTCLYAEPGKVYVSSFIDTIRGSNSCAGDDTMICETDPIFLSVTACEDCPTYGCEDAVTSGSLNPYMYGIYGNWRMDKSYVYYGQRVENDPAVATDIRKNGVIKSFVPFWSLSANKWQPSGDSSRWVWNSAITLFNKKGYELENKDPLGRYNSGQYGYNNSLPVSVTQNSKYREQFFDGFEDYSYSDQTCTAVCPVPREVDFTALGGILDTTNRHSGKYALRIDTGDSAMVSVPVTAISWDTASQKISADIDIKIINDTIVDAKGSGAMSIVNSTTQRGYIQPNSSGNYSITLTVNGASYASAYDFAVNLNGLNVANVQHSADSNKVTITTFLQVGEMYLIEALAHAASYFTSSATLKWSKCDITLQNIPTVNVYSMSDDTTNTLSYGEEDCSKLNSIYTDSSSLLPSFSPIQGTKLWLSGWVKENQDCKCTSYSNNQIEIIFTDSTNQKTTIIAKPTGNIIEGWQRYDTVITVPADAVSVMYKLKATGAFTTYFDDIRIHPYNANMKSFVYDPVNLRLMAELDENNYATFYEYDDDGTLIRVKKETQRGIQTIKETRSYMIKNPNESIPNQ